MVGVILPTDVVDQIVTGDDGRECLFPADAPACEVLDLFLGVEEQGVMVGVSDPVDEQIPVDITILREFLPAQRTKNNDTCASESKSASNVLS
jgi:hypothetical protein